MKAAFICLLVIICNSAYAQFDSQRNLGFEQAFAGFSESTNYTESISGRIRYSVTSDNRNVRLTFTLPVTLTNGSATIPITFSSTNAAYKITTGLDVSGSTLFNPAASLTQNLGTTRRIVVWLGATVTPPANATSGTYSRTITVTAEIL